MQLYKAAGPEIFNTKHTPPPPISQQEMHLISVLILQPYLFVCRHLKVCKKSPDLAQLCLVFSQHLLGTLKLLTVGVCFWTILEILDLRILAHFGFNTTSTEYPWGHD